MRALPWLLLMPAFAWAQQDPDAQWQKPPNAKPVAAPDAAWPAPPPKKPDPAPDAQWEQLPATRPAPTPDAQWNPPPGPVLPTAPDSPPPASRHAEPPPTPLPAPDAPATELGPAVPEVVDKPPGPPPEPRRFSFGHLALALNGSFGQSSYFGVRAELGAVYGWPTRMRNPEHARGITLGLAFDLLAAKIQVPSCGNAGICGSRYGAGFALRAAYNWGVTGQDAVVAPVHSVFVQAVPFLSSNSVPSAPLAPGATWGEHGIRWDIGFTSGFLRGSTWPKPSGFIIGGGLFVALSLEWLIINTDETGRFRGSLSVGLGL